MSLWAWLEAAAALRGVCRGVCDRSMHHTGHQGNQSLSGGLLVDGRGALTGRLDAALPAPAPHTTHHHRARRGQHGTPHTTERHPNQHHTLQPTHTTMERGGGSGMNDGGCFTLTPSLSGSSGR